MKLIRIVASQFQRYREISLFLFFVHFLKASDRLHLILHDPRLEGELIGYEMLSDEMDSYL